MRAVIAVIAEDEDTKRIYDVLNILEGVGLTAKKGRKLYSWAGRNKMWECLESLKEKAVEVELKDQIRRFEEEGQETPGLQFSRDEEREGFHLRELTEKIVMVFLSLDGRTLTNKQILSFVFNAEKKGTKQSVLQKVVKVLKVLVAMGLLSMVRTSDFGRSTVHYQLLEPLEDFEERMPEVQGELNILTMEEGMFQEEPVSNSIEELMLEEEV